jgi:hypothetical protein
VRRSWREGCGEGVADCPGHLTEPGDRSRSSAAAIAIPTAARVNFLWDELAHVRAGSSNRSSYERNGASSPVCVVLLVHCSLPQPPCQPP